MLLTKEAIMSKKESLPVDKRSKKDRRRKFTFSRFIYKGIDRDLERREINDLKPRSEKDGLWIGGKYWRF